MFRGDFIKSVSGVIAAGSATPATTTLAPHSWQPPLFPVLLRGQYNYDAMMAALQPRGRHNQIFLANPSLLTGPGVAGIFQKMTLSWTAYEFALDVRGKKQLGMAGVLLAEPVVFALNDAMWQKYHIARILKLPNRNGVIAESNFSRPAWSNLDLAASPNDPKGIYHDCTSEALLKRGAHFLVCHQAYAGISARFAQLSGIPHSEVLQDWTKNTLPGFTVVPGGGLAIQLAQEHGVRLYPITD